MIIAQLTDLHISAPGATPFARALDCGPRVERAIAFLKSLDPAPEICLLTGDITENGLPEEYAMAREMLAGLAMPVLAVPGNHDRRQPFIEHFLGPAAVPDSAFAQVDYDQLPIRLIGLDTLDEANTGGLLCEERLGWLEGKLAAGSDRPTIVFMHHPAYGIGLADNPAMMCAGGDALREILLRHPNVKAVLSGHVHRASATLFAHAVGYTAPAVSPPLQLLPSGADPQGWIDSTPSIALHLLKPDGSLVSHEVRIDETEALRRFR